MTDKHTSRPMPDHDEWPAFVVPWDDNLRAHRYVVPAGQARRGARALSRSRMATWPPAMASACASGARTSPATPLCPPWPLAPIIARRLAKYGINCMRLHHMDHRWPGGVLMRRSWQAASGETAGDRRCRAATTSRPARSTPRPWPGWTISSPAAAENGIYIDLNLNVSRPFTVGGWRQAGGVDRLWQGAHLL